MKTPRWFKLVALGAALASLGLLAACGDDDDDDSASGDVKASDVKPTGSDEKYVASLCKATLEFTETLQKIDPAAVSDESKIYDVLEKPYESFVNAVEDANPPKDLKDYHVEALRQLKVGLKAIKDKDQNAIEAIGDADFPDVPDSVQDRMDKAAKDNKDCQEAGVDFTE